MKVSTNKMDEIEVALNRRASRGELKNFRNIDVNNSQQIADIANGQIEETK